MILSLRRLAVLILKYRADEMGRKNFLIAINLALVILLGLTIYKSVTEKPENDIELSQDIVSGPVLSHDPASERVFRPNAPVPDSKRQTPLQKKDLSDSSAATSCFKECQARILKGLLSGQNLTTEDAVLMTQNADLFATVLAANPNALGALLTKLQEDEDEEGGNAAQMAAYAIETVLSGADRLSAGQELLGHADPALRIVGVKLAVNDEALDVSVAQTLKSLASQETNPRVLTALINAIPADKVSGVNSQDTIEVLDSLMSYKNSDYIRGRALVKKSRLAQSTSDVKVDVLRALREPSSKLRGYGLQAYAVFKTRHKNADIDIRGNDGEFHDLLNALVDDPNADEENRALALKLLRNKT